MVEKAFENEVHSDHKEHFLVAKLRKIDVFVPELLLVTENDEEIVWHLMLTKLLIKDSKRWQIKNSSLTLEPVSVKKF